VFGYSLLSHVVRFMIELNRDSPVNAVRRKAAHRSLPCALVCQFDQLPSRPAHPTTNPHPALNEATPRHQTFQNP